MEENVLCRVIAGTLACIPFVERNWDADCICTNGICTSVMLVCCISSHCFIKMCTVLVVTDLQHVSASPTPSPPVSAGRRQSLASPVTGSSAPWINVALILHNLKLGKLWLRLPGAFRPVVTGRGERLPSRFRVVLAANRSISRSKSICMGAK